MVIGLKEAIEEFLERQGMNKSQVFKTSKFFMGVLEDIESQWLVTEVTNITKLLDWLKSNHYLSQTEDTLNEITEQFLKTLK